YGVVCSVFTLEYDSIQSLDSYVCFISTILRKNGSMSNTMDIMFLKINLYRKSFKDKHLYQ
ncbi:hypothetical protein, partial [Polaribacter atrinae]|uniref:hypothetical protein n=1 Tax=Polaribacter atrinae TaxID=1333662 RepID=UPI000A8CA5E2